MAKLVAKTYSKALFDFALEANKVESINEEFGFVVESFKMSDDFFELFKTPKISIDDRKEIVNDVFGEKISKEMLNFLFIVLDKRRTNDIIRIQGEFHKLIDIHMGIVPAIVKSAKELDELEKEDLINKLKELTGKKIRLKTLVDPDVIGGLYIKVGDKVIDGSIRNKLNLIKESLRDTTV